LGVTTWEPLLKGAPPTRSIDRSTPNFGRSVMDSEAPHRLHKALEQAKQAAHQARLDNCDVGDIDEAIEAVDRELGQRTPNQNTLTLYLNSIARSLIAAPSARAARDAIDHALRASGLPATWEQ
jgi:hypothetical protein